MNSRLELSEGPGLLVTGASGFVGRHVIKAGRDRYAIHATGRGIRPKWLPYDVAWHQVDLLDRKSLDKLPRNLPYILHLASETVPSRFTSYDPLAESVEMTLNLCRYLTAGRMVFASSCLVYAASANRLEEDDPLDPRGNYGMAKAIGEAIVTRTPHIDAVVARPFNHIGAGMRADLVIPSIVRRVREAADGDPITMNGLNSIRDFVDIADIVTAYFALLELTNVPPSTFNVASGNPVCIGDVVRATARVLDKPIGEVCFTAQSNSADDTSSVVGNPERLRMATGWTPRISLAESLRRLVDSTP